MGEAPNLERVRVNGSLPVLTFVDDGTTDQDTCRVGTGTSANPVPDTVTVTLVPW